MLNPLYSGETLKDAGSNAVFVILVARAFLDQYVHQDSEIFMPFFVLLKDQNT